MTKYKVQKGDSLWAIAKKYLKDGNRYREIMKANGLTDEVIHPNMILTIPDAITSKSNYDEIGRAFEQAVKDVDNLQSVQKLYKMI